jgi:ribonuclease VapC
VIVDTSAIVALIRDEPEAPRFALALAAAGSSLMSAATYVETAAVVDSSRDPVAMRKLDQLLEVGGVGVEPLTEAQARIARQAYRDFGKGSGHPARLNLGDCFAYALAKDRDDTLLFKGEDFAHTDIVPATPEPDVHHS